MGLIRSSLFVTFHLAGFSVVLRYLQLTSFQSLSIGLSIAGFTNFTSVLLVNRRKLCHLLDSIAITIEVYPSSFSLAIQILVTSFIFYFNYPLSIHLQKSHPNFHLVKTSLFLCYHDKCTIVSAEYFILLLRSWE